jgi:metallo-beta-lactamase family protein
MDVQLFGAAKTVTGSCYGVHINASKIIIDCGMFQGSKELSKKNFEPFGFNAKEYTSMLLTHSHLDHCGRIPKLVNEGFKGKIYCTAPTKELTQIILLDSAHIQKMDTEQENTRRERMALPPRNPLYTEKDVIEAMKHFVVIKYNQEFQAAPGMMVRFFNAGHILGAASIRVELKEKGKIKTAIFSGDVGQYGAPIIPDPDHFEGAEYLFCESTYGNRVHAPLEERKDKLAQVINDNFEKHGKLLIPSFAIERTQELLYDIDELITKKRIPKMPIYIDSPMAEKATKVFVKYSSFYNDRTSKRLKAGDNPFDFEGLKFTNSVQDSMKLNDAEGPMIIIAGSGMCNAGRIKHHIKHNIWNPKNTILFVGYQSVGTLGYYIKNGAKVARLLGTEVAVKAKVESIDSYSGHADYRNLLRWIKSLTHYPMKAIVCHGEEEASNSFAEKLEEIGIEAYVPSLKEKIGLK